MGKGHRHAKKLKSEKAKVKLKGSKHLPKGTNVTDTNFKIKQIVVPQQLKTASDSEPLSKRKLNIKELLNRLQHYNTTVKTDAIKDLKDIVSLYPTEVVFPNLSQLIHGVSHLVLDKEKSIRQESLRLINIILTQVSVDQVTPFFDVLSSYFRCAMTHINSAIQEDSLLLLDILITHVPFLVALHSDKILNNFFDLISKLKTDSKPGRTLTINLNSKLTSVKWRIQVLNRLSSILHIIIQDKIKNNVGIKTELLDSKKHNVNQIYYPVYPENLSTCLINLNDMKNKSILQQENNIVKNINIIVTLLFETWLEVGPNEKDNTDIHLTEESASILNVILQIFNSLHIYLKMYGKETGDYDIEKYFILKYRKDFSKHIISCFPFTKIQSKKRKRNEKNSTVNSSFCIFENVMICSLFCDFNCKINSDKNQIQIAEKIIPYIENIFTDFNAEHCEEYHLALKVAKNLLLNISKSWNCCKNELFNILNTLINLYTNKKLDSELKWEIFNILCELINNNNFNKLPQFQNWLNTLPNLLCQDQISEKTVNMIISLAKQQNVSFRNELRHKFNNILENLRNIKILDTYDEISVKSKIISLVYYMPVEDYCKFAKNVANSNYDSYLKKYFDDVIVLKKISNTFL